MTANDKYQCSLLPHGVYTLIPTLLSILAWIASLSQDGCDYARLEGDNLHLLLKPYINETSTMEIPPFLEVGMSAFRSPDWNPIENKWHVDYSSECMHYSKAGFKFDLPFDLARIFAFLALVFGGGGAMFLCFSSCFVFAPSTWKYAGYEVALAAFFQLLTFTWFATELCHEGTSHCYMYYGANSDIIACIFWLVSAIVIFRKYPTPLAAQTPIANPEDSQGQSTSVSISNTSAELPLAGNSNVQKMELENDPGKLKDGQKIADADII